MSLVNLFPPLASEPRELVDLDNELLEDPTIASLSRVETNAQIFKESS